MNSNNRLNIAKYTNAKGSSLTEFAILTTVMLPIMIGIPMVGKMIDLKQTSINASRYAAWESTISDDYDVADHIKSRFFQDSEAQVRTLETSFSSNELWGETSANTPLTSVEKGTVRIIEDSPIAKPLSVNISREVGGTNLGIETFQWIADSGKYGGWAPDTDWTLEKDGLLRAAVEVKIEANELLKNSDSHCFEQNTTFSCMTSSSSIMVDHWAPSGDLQAANRARSFVPTAYVKGLGNSISRISVIPKFFDSLKGLKSRPGVSGFGMVNTSVLPKPLSEYEEQ